jgi:flavin-dependent dehydrogenase
MTYDALVIGGGPAGSTTAVLLAQAGWSVAIVEKSRFPRRKVCGEFLSATNLGLLDTLGIGEAFRAKAGPEIRRLALFAYGSTIVAPMPKVAGAGGWGRALGRETLDSLLLERATNVGTDIFQPATAVRLEPFADGQFCEIKTDRGRRTLQARVVIGAHGSWSRSIRAEEKVHPRRASDLLAFKGHFHGGSLPADLIPMIAFPGGYGGMVRTDGELINLSLCIRRDALAASRTWFPGSAAGDAVLSHILESCRGVREALTGAQRDGPWLAAGPIRPGIRKAYANDVFAAGNLVGEAHPVIAEGISMAIQSGQLLAAELIQRRKALATAMGRAEAGAAYSSEWRKAFATRIRLAGMVAGLATRPSAAVLLPFLARVPSILTLGARLSGKAVPPFGTFTSTGAPAPFLPGR